MLSISKTFLNTEKESWSFQKKGTHSWKLDGSLNIKILINIKTLKCTMDDELVGPINNHILSICHVAVTEGGIESIRCDVFPCGPQLVLISSSVGPDCDKALR